MFRNLNLAFQDSIVTRFITTILVSMLAGNALASGADEAFEELAAQYIADLPVFSPVNATLIGDHSADDRLDHVDAETRSHAEDLYRNYLDGISTVDMAALSRANQVDAELLRAEIESSLWALDSLQEWAWNPLVYVNLSGSAIYGLLARDFAPLEARLSSAASRLEQLPRFLMQVRNAIVPERVPKIHAETAVAQNVGLVSIIDTMIVPEMGSLTPATRERLAAAIEVAKDAIADHQTWLFGFGVTSQTVINELTEFPVISQPVRVGNIISYQVDAKCRLNVD